MPATIVSIYPATYNDPKPGLVPNSFEVQGSEDAITPTFTIIPDDCVIIKDIPLEENPDQRRILIPESAERVARAVVWDFIRACRLADNDIHPGIFFVVGPPVVNQNDLQRRYSAEFEHAAIAQAGWFEALVKEADDMWHRFRQFRSIDALHRMAAKFTGVKREWSIKIQAANLKACVFCTSEINDAAIVCPVCHQVVDAAGLARLQAEMGVN